MEGARGGARRDRVSAGRPGHPRGREDAAVPPERLGDYLRDFRSLLDEFDEAAEPAPHRSDLAVPLSASPGAITSSRRGAGGVPAS
ncbi:FAD-linked oxidase C-terminal domain-containing protein [Actinomadura decatromicini]|uniref:FAD-linked oxidase C-terminal domain-containing protein n=1 Tax=Actinomadura decatromicini TaxID=2604572 RepID=UPI003CCC77BE